MLLLLYLPQPDLAGHVELLECCERPADPGVYENAFHVILPKIRSSCRRIVYERTYLAMVFNPEGGRKPLVNTAGARAIHEYLDKIELIVIASKPYFRNDVVVILPAETVKAEFRSEAEVIEGELPDGRRVKVRYAYLRGEHLNVEVFESRKQEAEAEEQPSLEPFDPAKILRVIEEVTRKCNVRYKLLERRDDRIVVKLSGGPRKVESAIMLIRLHLLNMRAAVSRLYETPKHTYKDVVIDIHVPQGALS